MNLKPSGYVRQLQSYHRPLVEKAFHAKLVVFLHFPWRTMGDSQKAILIVKTPWCEVAHYVGIYTSVRCWSLMFMPMNCVVTRTLGAMSNVKINLAMSCLARNH